MMIESQYGALFSSHNYIELVSLKHWIFIYYIALFTLWPIIQNQLYSVTLKVLETCSMEKKDCASGFGGVR